MAKTILPDMLDGLAALKDMDESTQRKILTFTRGLKSGAIDAKDVLAMTDDERRGLVESMPEGRGDFLVVEGAA